MSPEELWDMRAGHASRFSDADIRHMYCELPLAGTVEELCRVGNLVVSGRGVCEEPVGLYEDVRHD
jgi:hypothetical protein